MGKEILILIWRKGRLRIMTLGRQSMGRWGLEVILIMLYRRGLRATLAWGNEDPKLELLRA